METSIDPGILEPVAARAWRAETEATLGGWRLYASAGFSGRINACWPLAAPDRELDQAIDGAEAWYATRGLAPVFKIVREACYPEGLVERLEARGYAANTETVMMVGPLEGEADPVVTVLADLDPGFEAVFIATGHTDPADSQERIDALARIVPPRGFARVDVGGAPVAIGAMAVEGEWAGIFGMRTAPEHRRKGLARLVFESLCATARAAGATRGYLQVEAANAPAIALYAQKGFEEAYRYAYWSKGWR